MHGARLVPLILDCVAQIGDTALVTALIAAGGDVSAATKNGYTPLLWECGFPQPHADIGYSSIG